LQCRAEALVTGSGSQSNKEERTWAIPIIDPFVLNLLAPPVESLDQLVKEVNPSHGDKNCADIVDVVIARLTGINPDAMARNINGANLESFESRYNIKYGTAFANIFDRVRKGGEGTIAVIVVTTPDRRSAHTIVIANYKGQVGIIEGQDWGTRGPAKVITSPREANERYNWDGRHLIGYGIVSP
jgi:hypothetical protein